MIGIKNKNKKQLALNLVFSRETLEEEFVVLCIWFPNTVHCIVHRCLVSIIFNFIEQNLKLLMVRYKIHFIVKCYLILISSFEIIA